MEHWTCYTQEECRVIYRAKIGKCHWVATASGKKWDAGRKFLKKKKACTPPQIHSRYFFFFFQLWRFKPCLGDALLFLSVCFNQRDHTRVQICSFHTKPSRFGTWESPISTWYQQTINVLVYDMCIPGWCVHIHGNVGVNMPRPVCGQPWYPLPFTLFGQSLCCLLLCSPG